VTKLLSSLGERIRYYREKRHLTQSELAAKIGVDKQSIWRWENAKSWLEYEKLVLLAEHLNIDPERLFETIGKTPEKPTVEEAIHVLAEAVGFDIDLRPIHEQESVRFTGKKKVTADKLDELSKRELVDYARDTLMNAESDAKQPKKRGR
jgi:transcriptional regulator with XRE-family HTH domain